MRFRKSFLITLTILLVYSIFIISFNFTHNLQVVDEFHSLDYVKNEKQFQDHKFQELEEIQSMTTTPLVTTLKEVISTVLLVRRPPPTAFRQSLATRANQQRVQSGEIRLVVFDGDVWWPGANKTPSNYYQFVHCTLPTFNSSSPSLVIIEITARPAKLQWSDIVFFESKVPESVSFLVTHRPLIMVYSLESEIAITGETWDRADFRMWYNLDQSYPEPVTYFDSRQHLIDLLSPLRVPFDKKKGLVVWAASNCFASNGREKLVEQMMKQIRVDSYGACMQNKLTSRRENMSLNQDLYSEYKFAIVIENSNCVDYVTEKLVHAVAAGTIPIVASRDNKPDYTRFMPKHSYINVYDYQNVSQLVAHLNHLAHNKTEYEKYFYFKRNLNATSLRGLETSQLIKEAKRVISFDENRAFYESGIVVKERSENKFCKMARHILSKNSTEELRREIEAKRTKRPTYNVMCLPAKELANRFNENKTIFY